MTSRTRSSASSTSSAACTRGPVPRTRPRGCVRARRSCSPSSRTSRRTSATRASTRRRSRVRASSRRDTSTSSSSPKARASASGSEQHGSSGASATSPILRSGTRRSWRSQLTGAFRVRSTSAASSARHSDAPPSNSAVRCSASQQTESTPVLKASGISVSFGGVHAVVDVDLEVGDGRLVGLIGPNGAGKTTFIDAITGFVRYRGRVELDEQDLTGLPPHARARLGLARTWQSIELFDDLTVRENLYVASHRPSVLRTLVETVTTPRTDSEAIDPTLELLELEPVADQLPSELSQGQRKLVGIARALVAQPRVVCLDEPAAGLDTHESEELGRRLRGLAEAGQSMLLVDPDMGLVRGSCDEVVVLEFGKGIARGTPHVVRRDRQVIEAYLGGAASELAPEALDSAAASAQEALSEGERG